MPEVYIPIPVDEVTEAEELPTLTYRLDLDAGRIVGMVDGLEAVNQAIRKAIITPRFKCLIYDNQYGSEIEDAFIAKDASREYIQAACEGFIRDCLKPDTRILSVYDFAFDFSEDRADVYFKADTIYGETEVKEVI
ncbi:uncharacterized protein DUF2634 [Fusobacterium naviforme]|nr:DUF2634 domain-containing protein [Fusobacterium naviforme]PSL10186.1 uncharacterized protein DUF2634 [Fusobacterium naviforme]STO27596.1 Protein of uncharacterised function (DUF2634) [Fusobacterium naviforme]